MVRRPTPPRARAPRQASARPRPGPPPGAGPRPRPASPAPPSAPDQFTVCTRLCGGACCRYVTVAIPPPRSVADWDEVRWWLAHQGTMVTHDHDGWMLHVETRCGHLRPDNACRVYPDRMLACEDHDPTDCEYTGDVPFDVLLRSEIDLARHLERRRLRRGREVARAIRRAATALAEAAALPAATPLAALVPLQGLPS